MSLPSEELPARTPPICERFLQSVDRRTRLPILPNQSLKGAAASVESSLSAIRASFWPPDVPFPHVFVASTIERDSWMKREQHLLFHDEGVIDIAVSTAEAINSSSRQSASFATFLFIAEQLVFQGRADLAALLGSQLFPPDGPSSQIFSAPDTSAWTQFVTKESHFGLHPPAKGFAGVLAFGDSQFQSVARHIFLAHELGHYLADFQQSKKILVSLKTPSDVLQEDEASADLIGAVLTVAALSRAADFQRPGAMTWLVAKTNLLLQIHHAFVEVRRIVREVAEDAGMADHPFNAAPERRNRANFVARELANPDTVRNLFGLGGSRARVIAETLDHYREYAGIVVNSILESAAVMAKTILRAWKIVKPPSASANWRISDHEPDPQAVLLRGRQALGNDIFRVLSVFSNQALGNRHWPHRSADCLSLDLRGQRSVGMKKRLLTKGIFLDVSDWRLEPV
jgi:hypothetical protein